MSKPMVSFEVKGAKELDAVLSKMEQKTARNVVTRAARQTLNPTLKEIRAKVNSDLDTMDSTARALYAKQIAVTTGRDRQANVTASIRTASKKVKSSKRKGMVNFQPLAHLFEGGVSPHSINQKKRTINHPGIPERPIWSQTFDSRASKMGDEFTSNIYKQLEREWAKKK
jgi:hypothetical protein